MDAARGRLHRALTARGRFPRVDPLRPAPGHDLVLVLDTMVAGVHYPGDTALEAVGYKAVAVNLSDLAAMGAAPRAIGVAVAGIETPGAARDLADGIASAGALDLLWVHETAGAPTLEISVLAIGEVPAGAALTRTGAGAGDDVYVTGCIGDAAVGLAAACEGLALPTVDAALLRARLDRPCPRVEAGLALRGVASACIDVSDGLLADLGHLVEHAGLGARIELAALPLSAAVRRALAGADLWPRILGGGDDYELLFTAPPRAAARVEAALAHCRHGVRRIGRIEAAPGVRVHAPDGRALDVQAGWDHFAAAERAR
ncbi:MAG: thiamine-phosphate kinase [Ectothiorhodospiraceae bacterium]|nr:thiamine-phosphate kinase [Chromatiales bacterium]MCP5156938.1 thiamine-phosphate kinase [Ectothiorhodospiraceae bacterium]